MPQHKSVMHETYKNAIYNKTISLVQLKCFSFFSSKQKSWFSHEIFLCSVYEFEKHKTAFTSNYCFDKLQQHAFWLHFIIVTQFFWKETKTERNFAFLFCMFVMHSWGPSRNGSKMVGKFTIFVVIKNCCL